jgi:hypothetical protein
MRLIGGHSNYYVPYIIGMVDTVMTPLASSMQSFGHEGAATTPAVQCSVSKQIRRNILGAVGLYEQMSSVLVTSGDLWTSVLVNCGGQSR